MSGQVDNEVPEPSTPKTPQPPFQLPCRSSSLAFSATKREKQSIGRFRAQKDVSASDPGLLVRRRTLATPTLLQIPPKHTVQTQDFLRVARASVHKDMIVASSPAGSIEARLRNGNHVTSTIATTPDMDIMAWRYSTAPADVAGLDLDVREPLLSPTLPDTNDTPTIDSEELVEPMSSGFCSPEGNDKKSHDISPLSKDHATELEVEFPATSPVSDANLNEDMVNLRVSEDELDLTLQLSPLISHSKRKSLDNAEDDDARGSPNSKIYLSETAEAAAQSAKAKRRLLKHIFDDETDDGEPGPTVPTFSHVEAGPLCPDPTAHEAADLLHGSNLPLPALSPPRLPYGFVPGMSRATATGSPMPFDRFASRPGTSQSHRPGSRACHSPQSQELGYIEQRPSHVRPTFGPMYSFSTAASKVVGSDQAPDSRIRDSYKTDTLTALARPASRFRKNGIGAELPPRGVGRYYHRPPTSIRPPSRSRPSSRQTYAGSSDVRFRSSPPRGPGSERYAPNHRKRALDDSFLAMKENIDPVSRVRPPGMHLHAPDIELDEDMKAAVRLSIFGASTPEALRKAREGIRELSPNVMVFRKGTQEAGHLRKKRRPSYWDNDLQEVRNSPAGIGGVNSPISAKQSLRAEVEMATELDLDDGDDVGVDDGTSMDIDV